MTDETRFDPRRRAAIRALVVTTAIDGRRSRPPRKRVTLLIALIVGAIVVSGGGVAFAFGTRLFVPEPAPVVTPTETPTPTPTPTATPRPSPEQTAAPSPVMNPEDPSTWTIGFDGVGPLKLGSSFEEERATLASFTDTTDALCTSGYLSLDGPDGVGVLLVGATTSGQTTAAIVVGHSGFDELPPSTSPTTEAGIGVDSTLAELLAAYPDIQQTGSYANMTTYYGVTDGNGAWIVFNVTNERIGTIQVANEATKPIENGSVKTMPPERCPA